jgi:hypothetical protein
MLMGLWSLLIFLGLPRTTPECTLTDVGRQGTKERPEAGFVGARAALAGQAGSRAALRRVAVPSEHGGWGLTAEPIALGLLVAPSISGTLLGAGTVIAFLARTPVKLLLVDHWRGRDLPRTALARRVASVEIGSLVVVLVAVALSAAGGWCVPLLAATPLVAVELWFDMHSHSRRLVPELCGAVGIAAVAAAIARAGGSSWPLSLGLWAVLAARSFAAIPLVRAQVQRLKGRDVGAGRLVVPAAAALAVAFGACWAGPVPLASAIAVTALVAWGFWSLRRPPARVAVLGAGQVAFGLGLVLVTAASVRSW